MSTDEILTAIAMVLTAVFGVFFYKYLKNRKTRNEKFIEKAKAQGSCTEGHCVDSRLSFGAEESKSERFRYNSLKVKYRYTVNGIVYHKSLTFQSPGTACIDYPAKILVYYDPRNPRKAVCPEEATWEQKRETGCLICLIGTFLFLFVSFHLLRFLVGLFL